MTIAQFQIKSVTAFCFRYPLTTPVVTSFGRMNDRPAVFVRAEDADGVVGWGEVWANFPSSGAEHRTRIINETLASMLRDFGSVTPLSAFERLTLRTSVLALQSGEPGPFAQAIAGIDLALWDLSSRNGLLEIDCNENPLRDDFCGAVAAVKDGKVTLSEEPGLGIVPDLAAIEHYRTV